MTWQLATLSDGSTHWLDQDAAAGVLSEVVRISSGWDSTTSELYAIDRRGPAAQREAVSNAWVALGRAYKALNLVPRTDLNYLNAVREAYGANIGLLIESNPDTPALVARARAADGWLSTLAVDAVASSFSGPQRGHIVDVFVNNDADFVIKTWLNDLGDARSDCWEPQACLRPTSGTYPVPRTWSMAQDPCRSPDDWRCVGFIGTETVFPPLVGSIELARRIAESIQSTGLIPAVEQARTIARSNGLRLSIVDPPAGAMPPEPTVQPVQPDPQTPPQGTPMALPNSPEGLLSAMMLSCEQWNALSVDEHIMAIRSLEMVSALQALQLAATVDQFCRSVFSPLQLMLFLNDTCTNWRNLSIADKEQRIRAFCTDRAIAYDPAFIGVVDTHCGLTPDPASPMPDPVTITLGTIGLTCQQWMSIPPDSRARVVQDGVLSALRLQVPPADAQMYAVAFTQYCEAFSPAPGSSPTKMSSVPTTGEGLVADLGTTCDEWAKNTSPDQTLTAQVYRARGLTPSAMELSAARSLIDGYCKARTTGMPTPAPVATSWMDGNGPLWLAGGALGGVLVYSAMSQPTGKKR